MNNNEISTNEIMEFLQENMVTKEELRLVEQNFTQKLDEQGLSFTQKLDEQGLSFTQKLNLQKLDLIDVMNEKFGELKGDLITMIKKKVELLPR